MRQQLDDVLTRVRRALETGAAEEVQRAVAGVHPADLAEVFAVLDDEQQSEFFFSLPARVAAEMVVELDTPDRGDVFEDMDDSALGDLVIALPPDDAADLLGELPNHQREEVLEHIPDDQADQIEELLGHDEESAGGIMTPELVALPMTATVAEAIERVRRVSEDEEIHYVYVVGDDKQLAGIVPLRRLVTNPPQTRLIDIADDRPVTVHVDDDQELVANKIRKYDIAAVPVVDDVGRLVGRVTHDDVLDVADEEAAEDLYYMAGTEAAELEEDSVARAAFIRLRWLLACMVGTAVSGLVVALFKPTFSLEIFGTMVLFVPMMGAMGGNSGIQISTIVIRGLATGDLASKHIGLTFSREASIAMIMAPACGMLAALVTYLGVPLLQSSGFVDMGIHVPRLAVSVGVGMVTAIMTASLLGIVLPHVFRKIGVDPAIASGPIVTTANDIVSVGMYFTIGSIIMA